MMTTSTKPSETVRLIFDDDKPPKVRTVPMRRVRDPEPLVLDVPPEAFELDMDPEHCGGCVCLEGEDASS
jgi:hypothetical protein